MKPEITFSNQFQLDAKELTTTLRFKGKDIASKDCKADADKVRQAHIEILAEEANKAMRYLCIHLPSDTETYRWIMNYHSRWKSDIDQLEYIAQPKNAAFLRKCVAAMPDTKNGKGCKAKMLFLNALITYYDNNFGECQPTGGVHSCRREAG